VCNTATSNLVQAHSDKIREQAHCDFSGELAAMRQTKEKPQNPDQEIGVYFSEKINRNLLIAAIYARLNHIDHKFNVNLRTIVGNCWDYCSEKGWRVQYIFVDLPERTGKKDKLNFERMIQKVKRGDFDVVVCWNCYSFDRSLLSSLGETTKSYRG
jgi:hypothetical protein